MFTKHVSQLNFSDIDDLVNIRKEREGYNLDYKKEIGNPDKAKKELAKDFAAFANTTGGYLIIGVDNLYSICGTDNLVQNKSIDEWINQILSSNVEPHIFYFDPKIIEIPDSSKVIVVIHIPESTKKPHIVTEINNYYIRVNDSSKSANHNQVRDMFEFSKRQSNEFNDFLTKKNLRNEDDIDFGINNNSQKLYSDVPEKLKRKKPLILFSLIPKYLDEEKINLPVNEFSEWLQKNSKGYEPASSFSLFYGHDDYDVRLDGLVLKHSRNNLTTSYFEVLNNGFVEAGLSTSLSHVYSNQRDGSLNVGITLTALIIYEMMLLSFTRKFYELAKYYDDVLLQVSFVNVLDYILIGLNSKHRGWRGDPPSNKQHNNFKLTYRFNPKTLTDADILQIAKLHSEKICRAFGLSKDYCFVGDDLTVQEMHHFYL
jgi:hypothetical protein